MSEYVFFFNDPATTELDTYRHPLALPDALPSCDQRLQVHLAGCDQFQRPVEDIGVTEHGLDPHLFRDRARHVELDLADRKSHEHDGRSEEHTSALQSLMRTSYAGICLKTKHKSTSNNEHTSTTTNNVPRH